jgi:ATP-dependent DNA helicase RecG
VYSDLNYIPTKWTEGKIELLKKYIKPLPNPPLSGEGIEESLPKHIIEKYGFISKVEAIYKIHFPKNKDDIEVAKYRLAYEELFDINYKAIHKKYENFERSEGKSISIPMNADLVKDIITQIEFDLTNHQKIVLFQILKDMEKSHGMQRLLE